VTEGKPLFVAAFNVDEARLAEFEDWYVKTHVPDGLAIPHFTRVLRYEKYGQALPLLESGPRFLNIYVIDRVDNIERAWLSKEREAASQDFFRWSDALRDGSQGIYVPTAVIDRPPGQ
jgi:hypothetical protein